MMSKTGPVVSDSVCFNGIRGLVGLRKIVDLYEGDKYLAFDPQSLAVNCDFSNVVPRHL